MGMVKSLGNQLINVGSKMAGLKRYDVAGGYRPSGGDLRYRTGAIATGYTEIDLRILIQEGLKVNPAVYTCNDRIVKNVDNVEWVIEKKQSDGTWVVDTAHEANLLITRPDHDRRMTWDTMVKAKITFLNMGGNFLIHKVRQGKKVIKYELLPLIQVKPKIDGYGYISYYEFGPEKIQIPPSDIIHGMEFNASDMSWGQSKLGVLSKIVDADNTAQTLITNVMKNGGSPAAIIKYKENFNTQDEFNSMQQTISEQWTEASNNGKPLLLPYDLDVVKMAMTIKDMEYLAMREYNWKVICAVFGVHESLVFTSQASTYNNIEQFKKNLWQDAIIPALNIIYSAVNYDLREEFNGQVRLNYSLVNVPIFRDDYGKKLDDAIKMKNLGANMQDINTKLDLGLTILG